MIEERIRLTNVYNMMLDRCYNKNSANFKNYGERGIYVDNRWLLDPTAFIEWALANGSAKGLQLDRTDNDGPYSPNNCRFVTPKENTRNRRTTVNVTAFGETKCIIDWLDDPRCVVKQYVIYQRIRTGWDPELALITPANDLSIRSLTAFGETKTWREWANDSRCQVNEKTLIARINRGWSHEKAIVTIPGGTRKGVTAPNAKMITAWGESKTVDEWIQDLRVIYLNKKGIWERINKFGWTPEKALTQPAGRGRPKKPA